MIETIINAIKDNHADAYSIRKAEEQAAELYFVKKELDMRRLTDTVTYEVTVYRDMEKDGVRMRGMSTANILPQMDAGMVKKKIDDAYFAAQFALNKYFELPKGKKEEHVVIDSALNKMTLEDIADAFVKALYDADVRNDSFINSSEFFAKRENITIYNSEGIEESYTDNFVKGEFVVQCREPQDVEMYQDFEYKELDTEALNRQAAEALETVCARANAIKAPNSGNYDVILSGKNLRTMLDFYLDRSNVAYIYAKYSDYKPGMQVQGDSVTGEKLNITLKATKPYSYEGIHMKDESLVENGELRMIYGNHRFSSYLGVKSTGNYEAVVLNNGTESMEDMKKTPYLYVVNFSDFQMDSFTGHFGGEIRLAYLYDGDKVTPVTGGSVNGSIIEMQNNLVFSTEKYKNSTYEGPFAVKMKNVPVAGAD